MGGEICSVLFFVSHIFCKRDWEVRFLIKEKQKRDREAGREMNYKTNGLFGWRGEGGGVEGSRVM